jgi:hypothetical protein
MGDTYMAPYLLKEVAFSVLLAAALVGFAGGSVLAWKAAGRLVGGIRRARPLLTSGWLTSFAMYGAGSKQEGAHLQQTSS